MKQDDPSHSSLTSPAINGLSVVATLSLLTAAWIATGTSGLWAHPMRKLLVLLCLLLSSLLHCLVPSDRKQSVLGSLILWLPSLGLLATDVIILHIAAVTWQGVMRALQARAPQQRITQSLAVTLVVFLTLRWGMDAIPWMWWMGDLKARILGQLVAGVFGHSLNLGMVFAAFDLWMLVVLFTFFLWLATPAPRKQRAGWLLLAVTVPQLVYLAIVAQVPSLLAWAEGMDEANRSFWIKGLLMFVPWYAPILAWLLHIVPQACMLRWLPGLTRPVTEFVPWKKRQRWGVLALACLVPIVTSLHVTPQSLSGKRIVFYEKGFLNWLRPEHDSYGRLSSGMYGMLPMYLQSLGATTKISPELSDDDLQDADVVVLLFPDDPWQPGQRQRLWDFIRDGGTLLLMAEHTTQDPNGASRFNEMLEPTQIHVNFDSATFAVGGWLHSYEALVHPATIGIGDRANDFGVVIGASLDIGFPVRPLLIGRWGWSDWGDLGSSRAQMGDDLYEGTEKIGDLILAAEQPLGKGRVVVFGDTSGLTNGINVGSHDFNRRLFTYLAHFKQASPAWRQLLGGLLLVVLVVWMGWGLDPGKLLAALLGLILAIVLVYVIVPSRATSLPDGRRESPNNLAYIDASHLGAHSSESWRDNGIGGLILTLMRNGYLTLHLDEFDSQRLERAGLLLCLSPRRSFSEPEIQQVQDYVNQGGLLIVTGGYEHFGHEQGLIEAFGFHVGRSPLQTMQPRALGHFKAPYLRSDSARVFVRFHAAWPMSSDSTDAQILAYGADALPVAMWRPYGQGKVVVIADTAFAQNLNLEHEDGSPFEGLRENAEFWRWLLSWLRDQEMWVPPAVRDIEEVTP